MLLALLVGQLQHRRTNFVINPTTTIMLYPDQVKVDGDWLSGVGQVKDGKILVSATVTKKQKQQINQGHLLVLTALEGEVEPIAPATNYGQFNSQQYYASKNIWQQVKLKTCQMRIRAGGIADHVHHWRFALQSYFSQMPKILGFFSSELFLGESLTRDSQVILDNYRNLGVIHILSISGLHVGIYTLVISIICSYLKLTEEEAFGCCLVVLILGILLSNGQAGFIRASLTYFLGKVFKFKGVRLAHFDLLGLACLLHLALNPRLLLGLGALLSYVLALGLELTSQMTSFKRSLALNFLLTPLLLLYFFQFNVLTIFFNLLVVPYFNWVVMPVTVINLVVFATIPNVALFFEDVLVISEGLIGKLSATRLGLLTFGKINWWQCLLLLALTAIWLLLVNDQGLTKRLRQRLMKVILFMYVIFFALIHFPLTGQVTFIDVGQGDSILVTTPFPRRVYLIDVGGRLNFGKRKITPQVNQITVPLLKAQGISKIDGIFVSHQDADHVGDLGPLLEQVKVGKLYMAAGLINNPSFRKRIAGKVRNNQLVQLLAGKQVIEPQVHFNVVYPLKPGRGENEDSLSLMFKLANKTWLFTGDLGQAGEQEIMTKYGLAVNYFKLGHHGSRTASNPDFLQNLQPDLVFISAGRNNRFGHPHPETLATLQSYHIPWVSTQDCGMITWTYGPLMRPQFNYFLPVIKK
ncbi:DNA internalization-related competence protein ComEC/Rec2 [Lactobacillus xylocopicola]|uniref:DNA internalization-related competence protein ComEC/Rec2 n=1 Tax=Lactobacillus xylocopicola TaxID=2976676 RepID=A0ABN6SJ95_9LACO|nr:DNA internalization-related competence protein ComEC/Rec2 [Lactobacillus xylocopicola]